MDNYANVKAENCCDLECLEEIYNLFALFDTPKHVVFVDEFFSNVMKFKDIFDRYSMAKNIFFSCKSNKSFALLKGAAEQDCGIEVSSIYELKDALKHSNKIIASGPAKDDDYLKMAIDNNVLISVDDIEELKEIKKMDREVKVLLRISDLGDRISRFGINKDQIDSCISLISESKIQLEGFSFHINNYSLDDRIDAIKEVVEIIREKHLKVKVIDIGGGLPTNYCSKEDYENFLKKNNKKMYFREHFITDYYPYYSELADENGLDYILKNTHNLLKEENLELIIEPGRSLLKNVGISIFEVAYTKHLSNKDTVVVTNGNINCLSEQWFSSDYLIEPVLRIKRPREKKVTYASIAGNLCLEQDMMTWRKIKFDYEPEKGDYLIYFNTAGYQMDSNESEFHKIPLVEKMVVEKKGDSYIIKEDKEYDC